MGKSSYSKEEKRKYDAERYKNPEIRAKKIRQVKEKYTKNKQRAMEYTGGMKCHNPKCSHNPTKLYHFDFHHVITENKTKGFHSLFNGPWKNVKKEIDDCKAIPLCSLCHRDEEYGWNN